MTYEQMAYDDGVEDAEQTGQDDALRAVLTMLADYRNSAGSYYDYGYITAHDLHMIDTQFSGAIRIVTDYLNPDTDA